MLVFLQGLGYLHTKGKMHRDIKVSLLELGSNMLLLAVLHTLVSVISGTFGTCSSHLGEVAKNGERQ